MGYSVAFSRGRLLAFTLGYAVQIGVLLVGLHDALFGTSRTSLAVVFAVSLAAIHLAVGVFIGLAVLNDMKPLVPFM